MASSNLCGRMNCLSPITKIRSQNYEPKDNGGHRYGRYYDEYLCNSKHRTRRYTPEKCWCNKVHVTSRAEYWDLDLLEWVVSKEIPNDQTTDIK